MKIFINNYLIALLLSLSFVLSSCGNSGDNAINDVSNEIRIINGTEYGASDLPQFVKILSQNTQGEVGACTGTMIGSKTVLTATHCLENVVALFVQVGDDLDNDPLYEVESFVFDENYGVLPDGRLVNDIAFLYLKESPGLPALPILAGSDITAGEYLMVVGFGLPSMDGTFGVRRAGTMRVTEVDPYHIMSTFDPKLSNVCFGDSGGPIIKLVKDANGNPLASALVGITSWGTTEDCAPGEMVFFTNLSSYISGIAQYVPDAVFY